MAQVTEPAGTEQRLLRNARREGGLIMGVWTACLCWSVGSGYILGYQRPRDLPNLAATAVALAGSPATGLLTAAAALHARSALAMNMPLVLGMPVWVFWSVALPWMICLGFSIWFCFGYMADDDLGQDPDEGAPRA